MRNNSTIELIDLAGPSIDRLTTAGLISVKTKLPSALSYTAAVPVATGWLLSGISATGNYETRKWDGTTLGNPVGAECLQGRERRLAALEEGGALAITYEPPFYLTVISDSAARSDCRRLELQFARNTATHTALIVAAGAISVQGLVVVSFADLRSDQRFYALLDRDLRTIRQGEASPVGFLGTLPDDVIVAYRQLRNPELLLYRYEMTTAKEGK